MINCSLFFTVALLKFINTLQWYTFQEICKDKNHNEELEHVYSKYYSSMQLVFEIVSNLIEQLQVFQKMSMLSFK